MNKYSVIKGPCLTEKNDQLQENYGKAVVKVDRNANKVEIKKAVEQIFNVKVANVRTTKVRGKQKRVGRHMGRTPDWKKAYITLKEGKINFLEEL
ncbi:MAG: 50S ribosomal protein L23 [Deltaproteobacteria bacterium]|jgi:large subunit ribosomal protein L23|nr:50S ribosomal protein L23 [Deltaproteobacteria bacterium]